MSLEGITNDKGFYYSDRYLTIASERPAREPDAAERPTGQRGSACRPAKASELPRKVESRGVDAELVLPPLTELDEPLGKRGRSHVADERGGR